MAKIKYFFYITQDESEVPEKLNECANNNILVDLKVVANQHGEIKQYVLFGKGVSKKKKRDIPERSLNKDEQMEAFYNHSSTVRNYSRDN